MAGDPDDELPRLLSRAEVKDVDYQIEMLARSVVRIDKDVAVSNERINRLILDLERLTKAIDDLASKVTDVVHTKSKWQGGAAAISRLADFATGGLVAALVTWALHR